VFFFSVGRSEITRLIACSAGGKDLLLLRFHLKDLQSQFFVGKADGMKLRFLGLEGKGVVTLRGMAPDLAAVSSYAGALRQGPLWESVDLRSAKSDPDRGGVVEFELVLKPVVNR